MSKFLNYVKKFLALSFMSATAAFLMSCNSNVNGIVQVVGISSYNVPEDQLENLKKVVGNDKFNENKVYTADKDDKKSVLYAVTDDQNTPGKCTAVVMENDATVYASIGSTTVNGSPKYNVDIIKDGTSKSATSLSIDSWDENSKINSGTYDASKTIPNLKLMNLKKMPEIYEDGSTSLIEFDPNYLVYNEGTLWATKEQKSPIVSNIKNNDVLYVFSDEFWSDLINDNFDNLAIKTGKFKINGESVDLQMTVNIKDPTFIKLSYIPKDENNNKKTYYKEVENLGINLCPLSKFSDNILELCKDKIVASDADNGYADQWKEILKTCISEYSKLSDKAKETKEVNFKDHDINIVCTPTDVLNKCLSAYVLSAAARDLCEYKNDSEKPYTPYTEKDILDSINYGKLSSDDKQYLLAMISATHTKMDDEFGGDIKTFAEPLVKELKEIIGNPEEQDPSDPGEKNPSNPGKTEDGPGNTEEQDPNSSKEKEKTDLENNPKENGSTEDEQKDKKGSNSSNVSSSSSSGTSNKSPSIKTGSESLLMLLSSFGLSSGVLLSLRKKK
jgi:hypothetical protein